MDRHQRSTTPGRRGSADGRDDRLRLSLAALGFLGLGSLGACGGSAEGGTMAPPPPPPQPPEPSFICAESSAGASEGLWQLQTSGVEGLIGIQFLDATTGRGLRRSRGPSGLPSSDFPPLLLTTSDGGSTWCRIRIPEDWRRDPGTSLRFIDPNIGFVGGGEGCTVMRTEDGGLTWTIRRLCEVAPFTPFLSITPIDSNRLWAGGEGVLFRSEDGGISWEEVAVPELDPESHPTGFAFFSPEVGVFTENQFGDIFRTTDGGQTWERQPNPGDRPFLFDIARVNATTAVVVGGLAAREVEIVRTTDAGETWEIIRPGVRATLWGVDFGSDGFGVAVGDGGTILVSTDGGASWTVEESPVQTQLLAVSVLDAEHAWVSGAGGVILVRRP